MTNATSPTFETTKPSLFKKVWGQFAGINVFGAPTCLFIYVTFALPILISLSFLIAPFQGNDEAPHFYRAVQLSEGRLTPVIAPAGHAAGDFLDSNIHRVGGYYLYFNIDRRGSSFGEAQSDRLATKATTLSGRREFVAFSNTVIYFPIAHLVPALTIEGARLFTKSPVAWLYACRVTNALTVVMLFSIAIAICDEGRWFVFLFALLPRTVFHSATLSADSLIFPFAGIFAGLLVHVARSGRLSQTQHLLFFIAMLFICVSKIAYIPLAALPPLIVLIRDRKLSKTSIILLGSSVATVLIWLIWASIIKNAVFPIRHGVNINVYGQLRWILSHPINGLSVLIHTVVRNGVFYLYWAVGGELGATALAVPKVLVISGYALLAATALFGQRTVRLQPVKLAATEIIVLGCATAVFLLLYMQFTAVANPIVDGVQGRYFLPLLPIAVAFIPKIKIKAAYAALGIILICGWISVASIDTVSLMYKRYDTFHPVEGLRFSNPNIMKIE